LFPVDQEEQASPAAGKKTKGMGLMLEPTKNRLKNFLVGGGGGGDGKISFNPSPDAAAATAGQESGGDQQHAVLCSGPPIADLFPETTVLFSDISGFTAWSAVREPRHVFTLLETIYGAFDAIAVKRGVFKVETIGDSYVAVTGLPEPREDHAICMVKFARDCRTQLLAVVQTLEVTLGPGTADLKMRFGLHSGEVTGGVLRGQKSRFQLFGDTVNTAARMESTGRKGRIQASQATATLLMNGGMGHWVQPRESLVEAKGKGTMQTYWIEVQQDIRVTPSAASASAVT
jgi:class 3 adenylate cyclase